MGAGSLESHMVAGDFDYLIKAWVSDMAAYRVDLPGVRETGLEELKNTVVMGA